MATEQVTTRRKRRRVGLAVLAGMVLLLQAGCGLVRIETSGLYGYIYTKTRMPFTKDLNKTPVVHTQTDGVIVKIKEPFSGLGVYTEFNTNALGDLAKKYNMSKLYYAELETFELFGIWRERRLYLYGEKE